MEPDLLLCADLDRTILPNGPQEESPLARPLLRNLAARAGVVLVYASGRDESLIREAIRDYELPVPDFAVSDVGTEIHAVSGDSWTRLEEWRRNLARQWKGVPRSRVEALVPDLEGLRLQEPEKQGEFKVSYYAPERVGDPIVLDSVRRRLTEAGLRVRMIWSVDETRSLGLLDVIPERATKLEAVRFVRDRLSARPERTVYAGDSGNDLPALTSDLQAVLVANATDVVRDEAVSSGDPERLYLAKGGLFGMNGCYAAGVLEGVVHFLPEAREWLEEGGAASAIP